MLGFHRHFEILMDSIASSIRGAYLIATELIYMENEPESKGFTIEDYCARSGASNSSLVSYRRMLGYCERDLGKPLAEATTADLERLKSRLRTMLSGSQKCVLLRSFYKKAGMPKHGEICVLKQRHAQKDPNLILTPDEVSKLIREANSARSRAIIGLLWETGGRRHEILALTLADVREGHTPDGKKFYSVFFRKMKETGTEHTAYVIETAKLLEEWLDVHPNKSPGSFLFVSRGGKQLLVMTVNDAVRSAVKRARIQKRVYPHLFRASRCTYLLRKGVNETLVRRLLGWKPGSVMIARYQALSDSDTYAATLRMNGFAEPETVDMGKVDVCDLQPVVAIWGEDAKDSVGAPWESLPAVEQAALIAKAIVKEQAALPPPVWSTPAPYLETIENLQKRLAVLEAKLEGT